MFCSVAHPPITKLFNCSVTKRFIFISIEGFEDRLIQLMIDAI
jgi:hypothetical protein